MKKISLVALSLVAALAFVGCAKKNNVVINSAEDLQGLKIGCQAGTTGELYVQENVADAKLASFKTMLKETGKKSVPLSANNTSNCSSGKFAL